MQHRLHTSAWRVTAAAAIAASAITLAGCGGGGDMHDAAAVTPLRGTAVEVSTAASAAAQVTPGGIVSSQGMAQGVARWMEVTLTIEQEPPAGSTYFWAQQFRPDATVDHGGYFGLQTGGLIGDKVVGKMLIFSIWNAVDAEAGPGAVAQPFGGEGIGYSVRLPFEWKEGVPYTFRLQRTGDPLWWELRVREPQGPPVRLGRIKVTLPVLLGPWLPQFTEYFTPVDGCEALPPARVTFSRLRFQGRGVPASAPTVYGPCAAWARATIDDGTAVHETGVTPQAR